MADTQAPHSHVRVAVLTRPVPASSTTRRLLSVPIILAIAAAPALALWFNISYVVGVPVDDQWYWLPQIVAFNNGSATILDLFKPYQVHVRSVQNLISALLLHVPGYSVSLDARLSWITLVVGLGLLIVLARQVLTTRLAVALVSVPIAWLWFNLRDVELALSPVHLGTAISATCVIASLVLLHKAIGLDRYFAGAIVTAIVASWTFGSGTLVWCAGAAQLIWQAWFRHHTLRSTTLAAWTVMGALVIATNTYLIVTYVVSTTEPGAQPVQQFLGVRLTLLLTLFGSAFTADDGVARWIGELLLAGYLAASAFLLKQVIRPTVPQLARFGPAIGCLTFSISALISVSFVRATQLGNAAPHYILFATPGMVAMILVMSRWAEGVSTASRWYLITPIMILLAVGLVEACQWGLGFGPTWRQYLDLNAYLIREYRYQDQSVFRRMLPKDPGSVLQFLPVLEEHGWGPFPAEPAPSLAPSRAAQRRIDMGLDVIDDEPAPASIAGSHTVVVDRAARPSIEIQGWAADPNTGPVSSLFLVIDGTTLVGVRYGLERPDIAASGLNVHNYRYVGFQAIFASSLLAAGRHELTFLIVPADLKGHAVVADERISIEI